MLTAHLPAGYITTKILQKSSHIQTLLWCGLLGSIFPDFDFAYLILMQDFGSSHREYWTHMPFFWLCITMTFGAFILFLKPHKNILIGGIFFLTNIWVHLILDTTMAPIYWFKPFSSEAIQWFTLTIEQKYNSWTLNYMLSSFFMAELSIWAIALYIWIKENYTLFRS